MRRMTDNERAKFAELLNLLADYIHAVTTRDDPRAAEFRESLRTRGINITTASQLLRDSEVNHD